LIIRLWCTLIDSNQLMTSSPFEFRLPSPIALTEMFKICCVTCFIALLPEEPARATSFKVG
jgi:hypothetical protein